MAKPLLRKRAIELRDGGFSYSYIQNQVNVSKSTLSLWLRDVSYTPNTETINKIKRVRANLVDGRKKIKQVSEEEALNLATKDIGKMSGRDLLMIGLGIYMGEGSKTVCLRLVNSDPTIIKTGIIWFKKTYGLTNKNFVVRVHLYPDCDIELSKKYWSKWTGLPLTQFHPVHVDKRLNKKIRNNRKLLFGTAHVTIRSGNRREFGMLLMRRILNSIDIVKNQAGLV